MRQAEIVLPDTSPETEWVRGRALRKVSPKRSHARVQLLFGAALARWAHGRGEVGTEWRFRIAPPGEPRRPLVPDIAFVSRDLMHGRTAEDLESPDFAPTVAVEVLSPGDATIDVAHKVEVYLRGGSRLVIVVDPARRTMVLHDAKGAHEFAGVDVIRHDALPMFRLRLDTFLSAALDIVA